MPQSLPTVSLTCWVPSLTSTVCVVSRRSPSTLMVSLPADAGIDRHHHGVAGSVFRLVDRGLQQVRRIGAAVGVPADIELHRGDRSVRLGRFDVEAIAAGLRRERHPRRLVGRQRQVAVGDALGRFDRLIFPRRVLAIPLVARLHLQQFVAQAIARKLLAVGADEHDVELGLVALGDALVSRIAA